MKIKKSKTKKKNHAEVSFPEELKKPELKKKNSKVSDNKLI